MTPPTLEAPRQCALQFDANPTPRKIREAILSEQNTQSEFVALSAPYAPRDQTAFQICGNERELLLGIALFHTQINRITKAEAELQDTAEIFFDLQHDRLGWFQFVFPPGDAQPQEYSFLPYPESHSSAFPLLRLEKYECRDETFPSATTSSWRCRWVFAWFDAKEIFRHSDTVGFNICRSRPDTLENSSWNYCSGNGFQDASGFGHLHRESQAKPAPVPAPECSVSKRPFLFSMTYDPPMSVMPNYYTPDRLRAEMQVLKEFGIQRLHWLEYPPDWKSFWEHWRWKENYQRTARECGDFLTSACEQAHANGLEFFATLKIFDLGFNTWFEDHKRASTALDLEGRYVVVSPEIAAHPEWTLQSNPAWRKETKYPIATLRFFSDEPIPEITPAQVRLLISEDNRSYQTYRGKYSVRQGVVNRPHYRWTPAGKVLDKNAGKAKNWFIEISGLKLSTPYAALQIKGAEVLLKHRGFMVMESEGCDGNESPLTVATTGHRDFTDSGYYFWKEWPDWVNYSEPILQRRSWNAADLGFTFKEATNMPTLLEPTYEGARNIWLSHVSRMLDAGADGIGIRILCHHTGPMAWLKFAFAPIVVETFQNLYGREPSTSPEDYERIRRIRGEALTQFLRDAKKLAAARGRKFSLHLESGIEVPVQLDTRMQIHLDWQTWISENIADELELKYWTSHSPFVHELVLPLARKHDVSVHVISRCLDNGFDHRGIETAQRLVQDAYCNGFDGFNFYEVDNLVEMSPTGHSIAKGLTTPALLRARGAIHL